MTPTNKLREISEKIISLFNENIYFTNSTLTPQIESILRETVEEALNNVYAKDEGDTLFIEGVRYAKGLFHTLGIQGGDIGTLFKIKDRKDGQLTIRTMKYEEALLEARSEAIEECLKIVEDHMGRIACDEVTERVRALKP